MINKCNRITANLTLVPINITSHILDDVLKAKINGMNSINILAGENIKIKQEDENFTISAFSSGELTINYENLSNKPRINNVELIGDKTSKNLKLQDEMDSLSNLDIDNIFKNQF